MPTVALRPLTAADYEPLWQLFLVVFPVKYKNEFLDAWLARSPELSHGAFTPDGALAGFIVTAPRACGAQMIEFLGVDPTAQQGGIGSLLLKKVLDQCRVMQTRVMLVPVNEPRVICWYARHGFRPQGAPRSSPYTGELEQVMELGCTAAESSKIAHTPAWPGACQASAAHDVSHEKTSSWPPGADRAPAYAVEPLLN